MKNNLPAIRQALQGPAIQKAVQARLGEKSGVFMTSLLDVIGEDQALMQCDPNLITKQALKAAGLDLPLNRNLGFAYVLAYKNKGVYEPTFQMGYKGYIQLAIRTGLYKNLNAGTVYEGEVIEDDKIWGTLKITGKPTSEKVLGYFASFKLINGFEKALFWSKDKVIRHAERFSKSYNSKFSPWTTDFDSMAKKTLILQLIPKYGPMSVEMSEAMKEDKGDFSEYNQNGSELHFEAAPEKEVIDIPGDDGPGEMSEEEKAEIRQQEAEEVQKGPGPGIHGGPDRRTDDPF